MGHLCSLRPQLDLEVGLKVYPVTMDGLHVAELAESAHVAASTVRFYERTGLISPARRAANGYRLFGPSALEELAFIRRAKEIGMTLEEIAELVVPWPATECRDVRAHLRRFLAERIDDVRDQQGMLEDLEAQLQTVLGRLSDRNAGPEPCGRSCGCESDLQMRADGSVADEALWRCTLDEDGLQFRLADWKALADVARSIQREGDAVRLEFAANPDLVASVARLCASETSCCTPVRFALDIITDTLILTARAPGALGLLEALFS